MNYYYALEREFRLLIHSRHLLSPALLSPHHIKPRIEPSWRRFYQSGSVTNEPRVDRLAADWQYMKYWLICKNPTKIPVSLRHYVPLKTLAIMKRCLYFNATYSSHHIRLEPLYTLKEAWCCGDCSSVLTRNLKSFLFLHPVSSWFTSVRKCLFSLKQRVTGSTERLKPIGPFVPFKEFVIVTSLSPFKVVSGSPLIHPLICFCESEAETGCTLAVTQALNRHRKSSQYWNQKHRPSLSLCDRPWYLKFMDWCRWLRQWCLRL